MTIKIRCGKEIMSLTIIFTLFLSILSFSALVSGTVFQSSTTNVFQTSSTSVSFSSTQFYQPSFNQFYSSTDIGNYWPQLLKKDECVGRQDILVNIPPGGCSPAVVRSDLLEEQNVPVFCKISATNFNPLMDVQSIDNVVITGKYPAEVSGVGFYPYRAALKTQDTLLGSPIMNDIGYAVVVLKKQPVEKDMPEFVQANLTARITYNAENALGIGRTEFSVPMLTDDEWQRDYQSYGFWNGRAYIKAEDIEAGKAGISIYKDPYQRVSNFVVNTGETSQPIYFPGFYCQAAVQIKLDSITYPSKRARLIIDGGDEIEVYENTKFLDDRCTVSKINDIGNGGNIVFSCSGNKATTLSISSAESKINITSLTDLTVSYENNYVVGDLLASSSDSTVKKNVYLIYSGELPENLASKDNPLGNRFLVLLETPMNVDKLSNSQIIKKVSDYIASPEARQIAASREADFNKSIQDIVRGGGALFASSSAYPDNRAYILTNDDIKRNVNIEDMGYSFTFKEFEGAIDSDYSGYGDNGINFEKFFEEAVNSYNGVAEQYPGESISPANNEIPTYGEQALSNAAGLAAETQKFKTQKEIDEKIISTYPNSQSAKSANADLTKIGTVSTKYATGSVNILNKFHTIELKEIKEPTQDELSVKIRFVPDVSKTDSTLTISGYYYPGDYILAPDSADKNKKNYILLKDVKINENGEKVALFDYSYNYTYTDPNDKTKTSEKIERSSQSVSVKNLDELNTNDGRESWRVFVDEINVKQVAKLEIIPYVVGPQVETNLTFKIGIEKRAIQLSDDKTKEMIANLNKSIEKIQGIVDKLGKVVTVMKGACLATSAALVVKNFVENLGGQGMARQKVIRGENGNGGWMQRCTIDVSAGKYKDVNECLAVNSEAINKDVDSMTSAIEAYNQKSQELEQGITETSTFGTKSVNTEAYAKKEIDYLKSAYPNNQVVKNLTSDSFANGEITIEDMQKIDVNSRVLSDNSASSELKQIAQSNLDSTLAGIKTIQEENVKIKSAQSNLQGLGIQSNILNYLPANTREGIWEGNYLDQSNAAGIPVSGKTPYQTISDGSNVYLVTLGYTGGTSYSPREIYQYNETTGKFSLTALDAKSRQAVLDRTKISQFTKYDSVSYNNPFKDKNPKVSYFETAPNKGLPAFVPIDVKTGWYVQTEQNVPLLGGSTQQAYEDSGRAVSFWLCNVGSNGVVQFKQPDDTCEMFNVNTGQSLGQYPGLSETQSRTMVAKAIEALKEAANQYGQKTISILGQPMEVGAPAAANLQTQCQDFMSPQDCTILFNVCDPVLCPSSRCDLGGKYPVSDVVQSGIIGSIALCLPNFGSPSKGGVLIPVCLTGIYAGLDSYLSILRSARDCMQESLDTGQNIGICDEIKSIYLCEFFWKELAPLLDILIPKIISLSYGQSVKGGGEYLTVQNAWQNMEKSVDYMTNTYALNAYKAFQIRSTQDVGTEVCKSFISTKFADFDAMLAPDSPTQFYAWFSETPYTTATVPSTSQYKVYYHIYAGKDIGSDFSVYLASPPESGYYAQNPTVVVDSGYIGRGQSADQSRDFTAPSGYKQLCVRINTQEQCGFGQVSTSFALDYLQEEYVKEQATQTVTTSAECVQGTPSLYSLAQPNLQAGVDASVNPEIYNRGITRVCASDNPGSATDPNRWSPVGYCDDKSVKCWIDVNAVSSVLKNADIRNETMNGIANVSAGQLIAQGDALGRDEIETQLVGIEKDIDQFKLSASYVATPTATPTSATPTTATATTTATTPTAATPTSATTTTTSEEIILQKAGEIIDSLNVLSGESVYNDQKANILLDIGRTNEIVARYYWNKVKPEIKKQSLAAANPVAPAAAQPSTPSVAAEKIIDYSNPSDALVQEGNVSCPDNSVFCEAKNNKDHNDYVSSLKCCNIINPGSSQSEFTSISQVDSYHFVCPENYLLRFVDVMGGGYANPIETVTYNLKYQQSCVKFSSILVDSSKKIEKDGYSNGESFSCNPGFAICGIITNTNTPFTYGQNAIDKLYCCPVSRINPISTEIPADSGTLVSNDNSADNSQQQTQTADCSSCGNGIFNLCDVSECHAIGTKQCYFTYGLIGLNSKCDSCEGKTCDSFNQGTHAFCTEGINGCGLSCAWVNNTCVNNSPSPFSQSSAY